MAGLFDSLIKEISNFAPQDDPGVKAFNVQNELKDVLEKEEKLYCELGKRVYADGGAAKYPDIEVQLQALASKRTEIQQRLDTAIAEKEKADLVAVAEGSNVCPSCGASNPEGTKFCSECGGKLETTAFCTACGSAIKPGMRFCGSCGARSVE